jgi:hypothetical protein
MPVDFVEGMGANAEAAPGAGRVAPPGAHENGMDRDALAFIKHAEAVAKESHDKLRALATSGGRRPADGAAAPDSAAAEGDDGATDDAPAAATDAGDDPLVAMPDGSEIPLSELIEQATKGGMRKEDYTRKTMAVAERQRQIVEDEAKIQDEIAKLSARSGELEAALHRTQLPVEDMRKLYEEEPGRWAAIMEQQRLIKEGIVAARNEATRAQQELQARRVPREIDALMEREASFKSKDGTFNEALYAQVGEYAIKQLGISQKDWTETINHPHIIGWLKAMRHDERTRKVGNVREKLANAPRVLRPGAAQRAAGDTASEAKRASEALSKQPSSNNAIAAAFLARRRQTVESARAKRLGGAPS